MNYAGSDSLFSFKSLFYNVEIIIEIKLDDCWKMKLKNNILPFGFFFSLTLITDHTLYVLKYIKVKCKRENNGRWKCRCINCNLSLFLSDNWWKWYWNDKRMNAFELLNCSIWNFLIFHLVFFLGCILLYLYNLINNWRIKGRLKEELTNGKMKNIITV